MWSSWLKCSTRRYRHLIILIIIHRLILSIIYIIMHKFLKWYPHYWLHILLFDNLLPKIVPLPRFVTWSRLSLYWLRWFLNFSVPFRGFHLGYIHFELNLVLRLFLISVNNILLLLHLLLWCFLQKRLFRLWEPNCIISLNLRIRELKLEPKWFFELTSL